MLVLMIFQGNNARKTAPSHLSSDVSTIQLQMDFIALLFSSTNKVSVRMFRLSRQLTHMYNKTNKRCWSKFRRIVIKWDGVGRKEEEKGKEREGFPCFG